MTEISEIMFYEKIVDLGLLGHRIIRVDFLGCEGPPPVEGIPLIDVLGVRMSYLSPQEYRDLVVEVGQEKADKTFLPISHFTDFLSFEQYWNMTKEILNRRTQAA